MKNLKKLVAIGLAASMVLSSNVVAFAVEGNGAVEYDNSTDIVYDQVTVPTLAANTYDMVLDATKQLHAYNPKDYGSDSATVFFKKTATKAQLNVVDTLTAIAGEGTVSDYTLWKVSYSPVTTIDSIKADITVSDGLVTDVTKEYYTWVPDTAKTDGLTSGNYGKMLLLDKDSITNYFKLTLGDDACTKVEKSDEWRSGDYVSDGNIYTITREPVTDNCDADTVLTLDANGTVKSVDNLYSLKGGTYTEVPKDKIALTPAIKGNDSQTDSVTVTNKSTKPKTIKATVTLLNPEGLTIATTADELASATTPAVLIKATNGTTNAVLEQNGDKVEAVYTVNLTKPTISEITYQKKLTAEENNGLGGHNYARYEAYGTTYNSTDSFYITASAGPADKEAWVEYAQSASAAPKLKVVYTIGDKVDSYTVTYKSNYDDGPEDATETVAANGNPTGPATAFTRDGYTLAGWATTEDGEAKALNTFTITANTTLYAIWTKKPITADPSSFDAFTTSAVISNIPEGGTLTSVKYLKTDGTYASLSEGNHWSYNSTTNTFTVLKDALNAASMAGNKWILSFGDEDSVEIPIVTE